MDWTEEYLEFIQAEFHKGHSTRRIVEAFNAKFGTNITRNSVLSRLHSIGLRRMEYSTAVKSSKTKATKKEPAKKPQPPEGASKPLPPEMDAPEQHCMLQELNRYRCHWPFGTTTPYKFCGARTMKLRGGEARSAYCPYHHAVATTASFAKYN